MRTIAVIGAGQMGTGIAQTVAAHGMQVMLSDIDLVPMPNERLFQHYPNTRSSWFP